MPVTLREYNQTRVFSVQGDLCADNAAALRQSTEQQDEPSRYSDLIIDLHRCAYINSTGLEALLAVKRQCEGQLGRLKLIGLNDQCRTILQITRLYGLFVCEDDLPTALANLE
jgi:anti-sigma B factor antagonist